MATRSKSICRHAGCNRLVDVAGYCDAHQSESTGWNRTSTKSAAKRGYGAFWRKLRDAVLNRDMFLCKVCLRQGKIVQGHEVDHIVPKSDGGTDDMDNLQTICRSCHRAKTADESRRHR